MHPTHLPPTVMRSTIIFCPKGLESTVKDLNFIFITGGLGPTHDDVTLSSFKEIFNLNSSVDLKYIKTESEEK